MQEDCRSSLLNAMALGKPVLATLVGGMPEVNRRRRHRASRPPSTDAIVSGLEELIRDATLRDRLGMRPGMVMDHLTWDNVASRHIALVRKS